MLHTIDGDTYNIVMLDDGPDTPMDALNLFKATAAGQDEFITDITIHYRRPVGPGMGMLDA